MNVKKVRMIRIIVPFALVLSWGILPAYSCGPFFPTTYFEYSLHPDFPLETFAKGRLGILKPTYAASYLLVAYRYLAGIPLDEEEQQAMVGLWKGRFFEDQRTRPPVWEWLAMREKVPGSQKFQYLDATRSEQRGGHFLWYLNCTDDAFITARKTLEERIEKFGLRSFEVREWLSAQDMVFVNCPKGPTIPPLAPDGIHPLIKADRAYQIAAAHFYAGDFDTAENLFREIAKDPSSPWKEIAPYLAIRAIVRKASLTEGEGKNNRTLLAGAKAELSVLLADKSLSKMHPAAERLLDLVQVRANPEKRIKELSVAILKGRSGSTLKTKVEDYLYLSNLPEEERPDELTDWIRSFQGDNLDPCMRGWKETHSLPWLVAALSKMKTDHPDLRALLDEADKVIPGSPAFPSLSYYGIRLLLDSGRTEEALRRLDQLLSKDRDLLPQSSINIFLGLRMKLARDFKEFLADAKRMPAGIFYDFGGKGVPQEEDALWDKEFKRFEGLPLLDSDSVGVFNKEISLRMALDAVKGDRLPEHLRRQVALSAWVRAVLIDQNEIAAELATSLQGLVPELKSEFAASLSEKNKKDRKFSALLLILRNPGMTPYLQPGIGRLTPLDRIDEYRDNWWCSGQEGREFATPCPLVESAAKSPAFLTEDNRKEGEQEWNALLKIGAAPDYLTRQVIERFKMKPQDPRIPEALHFAVKSTRYGRVTRDTSDLSKEAFTVLHRRYPNSPWTQKTPYWF